MKLTNSQLDALKADWNNKVVSTISNQIGRIANKDEMQDEVFQNDVADEFLEAIRSTWDSSDYDESDLVEWIRDIQNDMIENALPVAVPLRQYIADNFKTQREFADKQGVKPQQVTQWLKRDGYVIEDALYTRRSELSC